jgi:hypothetical protein
VPTCVCGMENQSGSRFCEACGKPMMAATSQSSATPAAQLQSKQQRSRDKVLAIIIPIGVILAGLMWWFNRPAAPYHAADPGIYPFIAADTTGADKLGFIDAQGNVVIQAQWDVIDPDRLNDLLLFCNEGLCKVRKDGKFGYIDTKGDEVIPGKFDNARLFVNGMAAVAVGNQWGFIDKTGHYIINPQYDDVGDFLGDVAAAKSQYKWGYIDTTGKFKVQPTFDALSRSSFADGLAAARMGGRIGYIDSHGKFVIPPTFEEAGDFSEGLAQVRLGSKWGYINDSGKFVINPQFDEASGFIGGKALVSVSGRQGTIDKHGRYAINPGQYTLNPVAGAAGLLEIMSDDGIGLISRDGSSVLPPSRGISRILISFGQAYYVIIQNKPVPINTSGKVLGGWYKGDSLSALEQDMQNERSAVNSMRTLLNAEASYAAARPTSGFSPELGMLGPAADPTDQTYAGLIDAALATGTKDGYHFTIKITSEASNGGVNSNYVASAQPVSGHVGPTFCADSSRIIHYAAAGQTCTTASPNY